MEKKVVGGVIVGYVGEEKVEPIKAEPIVEEAPIVEEKKAPTKKAKK